MGLLKNIRKAVSKVAGAPLKASVKAAVAPAKMAERITAKAGLPTAGLASRGAALAVSRGNGPVMAMANGGKVKNSPKRG